jgi:hypothetical protein
MNRKQETRLEELRTAYGVVHEEERWRAVFVECEDGDRAIIYEHGAVNWITTSGPSRTKPSAPTREVA